VQDLTAYRTIALRDALARDFNTAFLAVLHAVALRAFYQYGAATCLQLEPRFHFPDQAPGLSDLACAQAVASRHTQWQSRLPEDASWLWRALVQLPTNDRADLFAHCACLTVNAVREPHRRDADRLQHADQLASMLQLDLKQAGFEPTAENYFGRITKSRILEDVRDAKGEGSAQLIDHLKKPEMAKEAQRLIADTDWLPPVLRTVDLAGATSGAQTGATELPAFLDDADEQTASEAA
jgi:ParB family chromosome partitioning protein